MDYQDNMIGKEPDDEEYEIIDEFTKQGRVSGNFDIFTYDMVQCGYPKPDHGEMIVRAYHGTDSSNNLIPGKGMWMKTADVELYINYLKYCFHHHGDFDTPYTPTFEEYKSNPENF